jgi:hypothetical protein
LRARHHASAVPAVDDAPRITRSGTETRQRFLVGRMRCTPSEYAQLEDAAERAGMTIGAFMRHQCLSTAGPRATRRPPVERAALAQLLAQLGKCGSNLNQMARVLNSGGDTPLGIPAAIDDFRTVCADIMHALGSRTDAA